MLRVINHQTGDESTFENGDDFEKMLRADKTVKGSAKWHAERGQALHYSVYENGTLVSHVVDGKGQPIKQDPVSSADLAQAGAGLEQRVNALELSMTELAGRFATLNDRFSQLGEQAAALEARLATLESSSSSSSQGASNKHK